MKNTGQPQLTTGIIYRNPLPHVTSKHAYFPSLVVAENGEMLVSFAVGEAFEALNLDTFISRSNDGGISWSSPKILLPSDDIQNISQFARLTYLGNGLTVAIVDRCLRGEHPTEGLANPSNMGFVPTKFFLLTSSDFGNTWSPPLEIVPPLTGPSFELCSAIVRLSNGLWIWPTSTWRDWDGSEPEGMKMVAFVSRDEGKTWPDYWIVMDNHKDKIIYWESKIVELTKDRYVAVAWTFDEKNGKDLPIHYVTSGNQGDSWSKPVATDLLGQTVFILKLDDKQVMVVYRRSDKPGLWAAICSVSDNEWKTLYQVPLWGSTENSLKDKSGNIVQDFNELKFGAPSVAAINEKEFFVTFWCYEKMVSNIRWIKFSLQ